MRYSNRAPRRWLADVAESIASAHQNRHPIPRVSDRYSLSLVEAYEIQRLVVDRLSSALSAKRVGYKVSLTNLETQGRVGATEPTFGEILGPWVKVSPARIRMREYLSPLIEMEMMIRTTAEIHGDMTEDELASRCEVAAGLELPESRFCNWYRNLRLTDVIADNSVAGVLVIGKAWKRLTPESIRCVDAQVTFDGQIVATGSGRDVFGSPYRSIGWLARQADRATRTLPPGLLVSTGSLALPFPAKLGTYQASFSDGLGEVRVSFEA